MISRLLLIVDAIAAACVLAAMWLRVAWHAARRSPARPAAEHRLLALDMSYTLAAVRARQLDEPITARDLNGFFSHVWSVHPCATVVADAGEPSTFGTFVITPFAPRHTVIEGKVGRFEALRRLPMFNFLLAQYELTGFLETLIDRESISVIRAGDPYYLGLLGVALARSTHVPCVFRIPLNYDTFYERMGHLAYPRLFRWRRLEQAVSRFALKRADLVAGSNQDSLDFALANGARREHATIFRVGNLIHRAHFQPPEDRPDASPILRELGLEGRTFSVTMCRLEPLKHMDDVIRALAEVRKQGIDMYALLVGDGRLRDELIALADTLGIRPYVIFAGNRSQEWIATVLPRATVVLSPHMGRGLTEALLSGVAAVAYDVEWQGEIVRSGTTGELVEYRNWREMARATTTLCRDEDYAETLGRNARIATLDMMDPAKLSQHERDEYVRLFQRLRPQKA